MVKYNDFSASLETYLLLWIDAFYGGNTDIAAQILAAIKRHPRFGESLEANILEGAHHFWKDGLESDEISGLWSKAKGILKATPLHQCETDPCNYCCEEAFLLGYANLGTGMYQEAVEDMNRVLRHYEDDLMALFLRAHIWLLSSLESSEAEEAEYCTHALKDFEAVNVLVEQLPDNRVYFLRTVRERMSEDSGSVDDFFQCLKNVGLIETLKQKKEDTVPLPFDLLSVPVDAFNTMCKHLTAQTLRSLDRLDEALPILREVLESTRASDDIELVAMVMHSFAETLNPNDNRNDALLLLESGPAVAREVSDKELSAMLLYSIAKIQICLDQTDAAIESLTQTVDAARASGNEELIVSLLSLTIGKLLIELDRPDDTLWFLAQAFAHLQSDDALKTYLEALAICLLNLKNPVRALPFLTDIYKYVRAYDNKEDFDNMLYTFSVYFSKLRTPEEATAFFEMIYKAVLSIDGKEHIPDVLFTLAICLLICAKPVNVLPFLKAFYESVSCHEDEVLIVCVDFFIRMYLDNIDMKKLEEDS